MSAVTFVLKADLRQRLDVSPLIPDALSGLDERQIASLSLQYGSRRLCVGDLFDVQLSPTLAPDIVFRGGSEKFDYLGRGMARGEILVEGTAGAYAGHQMKGGKVRITQGVGIFCAAEMRGGQLFVDGDAGDFLGAALPGNRKGMAGGAVVVRGSVGARAGDHMRRGLVLIEGDAGPYLGARMVAGTIAVVGAVGAYAGYAMKRGTLLFKSAPDRLPPTFNDCGTHSLGFLPLLIRSFDLLGVSGFHSPRGPLTRVRRFAGDAAVAGKGEILVAIE
jgi:formylmethanofuran dehydrogenase subunit C